MNYRQAYVFILAMLLFGACTGGEKPTSKSQELKENAKLEKEAIAANSQAESQSKKVDKTIEEEKEVKLESPPAMDVFDPDFANGKWEAEDQNGFSFSTWFYVEDGILKGQYCAINEDASRIDCGTQDEVDLCYLMSESVLNVKELEIEVVSCYSQKHGKALLSPHGDGHLKWTLTQPPGEFGLDHYAPSEAILYKVSFDPFE